MARRSSMRRVRKGQVRMRESGFIVTWDVDSVDQITASRLRRFVFGDSSLHGGKVYRYPGFVEWEGVRYMGQSVLFVKPPLLKEILGTLERLGIDRESTPATVG